MAGTSTTMRVWKGHKLSRVTVPVSRGGPKRGSMVVTLVIVTQVLKPGPWEERGVKWDIHREGRSTRHSLLLGFLSRVRYRNDTYMFLLFTFNTNFWNRVMYERVW